MMFKGQMGCHGGGYIPPFDGFPRGGLVIPRLSCQGLLHNNSGLPPPRAYLNSHPGRNAHLRATLLSNEYNCCRLHHVHSILTQDSLTILETYVYGRIDFVFDLCLNTTSFLHTSLLHLETTTAQLPEEASCDVTCTRVNHTATVSTWYHSVTITLPKTQEEAVSFRRRSKNQTLAGEWRQIRGHF